MPNPRFATTRWSLVLAAGGGEGAGSARVALGDLCAMYWEPVFCYLRRKGHDHEDAMDLTQGFLTALLERGEMRGPDRHRGKFRSYLLGALNHFVSNEAKKARAKKRGGGIPNLPLEFGDAEARFLAEPATTRTPEEEFTRRWGLTVLEETLAALRKRYEARGRGAVFERLHPLIWGEKEEARYADLAAEFGMSADALKMTVSRMRSRYRDELRSRIADTVSAPEDVEDEMRALIRALQ